jgi:hypothetical protein
MMCECYGLLIQCEKVLEQASRSASGILVLRDECELTVRRSDDVRMLQSLDLVRKGAGASFKISFWNAGAAR